jgi:hypothetical protein
MHLRIDDPTHPSDLRRIGVIGVTANSSGPAGMGRSCTGKQN